MQPQTAEGILLFCIHSQCQPDYTCNQFNIYVNCIMLQFLYCSCLFWREWRRKLWWSLPQRYQNIQYEYSCWTSWWLSPLPNWYQDSIQVYMHHTILLVIIYNMHSSVMALLRVMALLEPVPEGTQQTLMETIWLEQQQGVGNTWIKSPYWQCPAQVLSRY